MMPSFRIQLSMLDIKAARVMQQVGSDSTACNCAGQGKIPDQSLWELLVDIVALGDRLCGLVVRVSG